MEDPNGFSFTKLCIDVGMMEELQKAAMQHDDVLAYAISRISQSS